MIVTEWKLFREANLEVVRQKLADAIIFDGRNLYDPAKVKALGIEYHAIGRAVLTQN